MTPIHTIIMWVLSTVTITHHFSNVCCSVSYYRDGKTLHSILGSKNNADVSIVMTSESPPHVECVYQNSPWGIGLTRELKFVPKGTFCKILWFLWFGLKVLNWPRVITTATLNTEIFGDFLFWLFKFGTNFESVSSKSTDTYQSTDTY